MNDDEVAFRIVRLYFEEIARLGFKRQLDLDQMINAYFYTLKKLKGKDEAMKRIVSEMKGKDFESFRTETRTTTSVAEVPVVKETTVTTTETKIDNSKKSVSDILEEK